VYSVYWLGYHDWLGYWAACTFDNGYRKLARPKVRGQGAIVFNLCWNAE
jgi:hypothetical protein